MAASFPSRWAILALATTSSAFPAHRLQQGDSARAADTAAEDLHPGLRNLYSKAYQAFSLTPEEFDRLWTVWPADLRALAEAAAPSERRAMALERYGLPLDPRRGSDVPAAFADPGDGRWVLNCLACHQGALDGQTVPGLGNTTFAFRTLADDYLWLRRGEDRRDAWLESQFGFVSLGETNGTTNAQVFSALLAGMRQPDLSFDGPARLPHVVSGDLDAPALWHLAKKSRLYADGYIEKDSRVVMQFALAVENTGEQIRGWEKDFEQILAWMESVEAPPYPYPIDRDLAAQGKLAFEEVCADCHGTYGAQPTYPERRIPLDELGTDPIRQRGVSKGFREWMRDSWLGHEGELDIILEPDGYMAPPLDGLWASAPYLHNGSVPTLEHLLWPKDRPTVWRRLPGYDSVRIGLAIEEADSLPERQRGDVERTWYDTRRASKSAAGHTFPDALNADEKRALLEYLKTL